MKRFAPCTVLFGMLVAACGGDDKGTSTSSSGGSSSSSTSSSSGGGGDGGGSSGVAPRTIPPLTIDRVTKMTGSLHVTWRLPTEFQCEAIEGERKTATIAYAVVFSVPGTVDNKHDTTASEDTLYTYRLRCKYGANYSVYSNEMGLNPQQ